MFKIHFFLIIAILICAAPAHAAASVESAAQPPDDSNWVIAQSNFFEVYYRPDANLDNIKHELERRPLYFDQPARYGEAAVLEEICRRLDNLFNEVKELLDMYPKIAKVNIKIFRDRMELNKEYFKIFGKNEGYRSFYINKYNTIYTSEADITDSIMSHEMAHVVIDHYFKVIPPEKLAEILASYVDAHLGD